MPISRYLPLTLAGFCCTFVHFAGAYAAGLVTEEQRFDMVRHACPGAGACGGMYTANTMASSIEALGMSLPYSSSIPATDPLKLDECRMAGRCAVLRISCVCVPSGHWCGNSAASLHMCTWG
jgi:dihydroxyacid dehydratase/phosphogluconate dehydratase